MELRWFLDLRVLSREMIIESMGASENTKRKGVDQRKGGGGEA